MNPDYKRTDLPCGLKIVSHKMAQRQSLALGILITVGGRYEFARNKGISHFLEHLLFKGTKKYSCRKIKESIEGIGGALNGFTSEEVTCYLVKIPSRHLELGLSVLSDMVINPTLPVLEVEKEKQVILEEIKMYRDQPQSYVYELLDELLWPNQPLGTPIIGSVDSVSALKREDLKVYKQNHYTSSNIIVSAAGLLEHEKIVAAIKKHFGSFKPLNKNVFQGARVEQENPRVKILNKDTEQTHMALGFHSLSRNHPLKHALGLLHIILGANMSSRLFHELREKRGLAYEIGTAVKRFQDTGAFLVHAGIDNRKIEETIKLILKELMKPASSLVSTDEFSRAKEFYLGQLMLALEDTLEHMLWIGETTATLDRTYSLQDIIKEVNKVTRDDLRKVARLIFDTRKLNLAIIGPLKQKEEELLKSINV